VELFTAAYDLTKTDEYVSWEDRQKKDISNIFNTDNKLIRMSSKFSTPKKALINI
jgi:hypothetical protein